MLGAEWLQVLQGSVGMGTKEDETSTGSIWVAAFHHVIAHSCLAGVLVTLKPLKMDLIEGSETSANINQMLGIHPKIETVNMNHFFNFQIFFRAVV
jgi:hypothetical protein